MECTVAFCVNKAKSKGFCVKHYTRFIRYGNTETVLSPRGEARKFFYNLVNTSVDECITWPFTTHGNPKRPWISLSKDKRGGVSRLICETVNGPAVGEKNQAAHNCGKEWCVNPKHIRWATPKENAHDKIAHGTISRGEKQGSSKINEKDVREIRELDGKMTKSAIARMFGIGDMQVGRIIRRERWGHIS